MAKPVRQITFRVPKKMWEDFTIKTVKEGMNKTKALISLIEKYLKNK